MNTRCLVGDRSIVMPPMWIGGNCGRWTCRTAGEARSREFADVVHDVDLIRARLVLTGRLRCGPVLLRQGRQRAEPETRAQKQPYQHRSPETHHRSPSRECSRRAVKPLDQEQRHQYADHRAEHGAGNRGQDPPRRRPTTEPDQHTGDPATMKSLGADAPQRPPPERRLENQPVADAPAHCSPGCRLAPAMPSTGRRRRLPPRPPPDSGRRGSLFAAVLAVERSGRGSTSCRRTRGTPPPRERCPRSRACWSTHWPTKHEHQEAHGELHTEPGVLHRPAPVGGFHAAKLPACEKFRKLVAIGTTVDITLPWTTSRVCGLADRTNSHPAHT